MSTHERPRDIWTRLAVDPLADPLVRRISVHAWVTPNRITALSMTLGLAAAACFAVGRLRLGGVLFVARFFTDCLDGKVSRLQGTSSTRGAFLDTAADVTGVTLAFATLGWHLQDNGPLPTYATPALVTVLVVYNWAVGHRKHLAEQAGLGSGGADHVWQPSAPVVRSWVALCRRLGMIAVPWTVEVEIATLGLSPLLLAPDLVAGVYLGALAFYVLAVAVNLRRAWRIAGVLDHGPTGAGPIRAER
ncbi:MAG TPA: CDP-alcohol phosphatidyltransferase family protein [Nocardioides sp.]|nr:CDP-alcohol phosphatidyltransferase family protein [Nocardioides sp.]